MSLLNSAHGIGRDRHRDMRAAILASLMAIATAFQCAGAVMAQDAAPASPEQPSISRDAEPAPPGRALPPPGPQSSSPAASPPETNPAPSPAPQASPPQSTAPQATGPVNVTRSHLPRELSPWGMFMAADNVVKGVMLLLAFASVLVWSIWVAKTLQLLIARRRIRRGCRLLDEAPSLAEAAARLGAKRGTAALMAAAALAEIQRSDEATLPAAGIKERIGSSLARIEAAATRAMNGGTGILATVGGTAPFVGLFGTVWGIMNSFIGISKAQTTNLAVVAPGIAEALLATAIGLVAAIPAVIFYNQLARSSAGYRAGLADAASAVERLASRDLDRLAATRAGQTRPPLGG